jgi:threonine/homoserine/homoserine lactone efflux protein
MNILEFAGEVILLSTSGVLSPGPLFYINLIYGSKQGGGIHTGIKIAYGHTIVELPLIIILTLGLSKLSSVYLISNENLKIIGLIGGVSITVFSLIQIHSIIKRKVAIYVDANSNKNYFPKIKHKTNGPIILGIFFTALNPFFLVWWSTVGLKLISDSILSFGVILGVMFTFFFHIWMDYAWLTGTSYMISKGISILKAKFYNVLLFILSILLALSGLYLIVVNIAQAITAL